MQWKIIVNIIVDGCGVVQVDIFAMKGKIEIRMLGSVLNHGVVVIFSIVSWDQVINCTTNINSQ